MLQSPQRRLSILLWLVALHSLAVGIGLIAAPDSLLSFFGFPFGGERFFRAQAGVFHFVMVVVYLMAASRFVVSSDSTYLAITAKMMAMVFLVFYYLLVSQVWMILISGIGDGAMGLLILWGYRSFRRSLSSPSRGAAGEGRLAIDD